MTIDELAKSQNFWHIAFSLLPGQDLFSYTNAIFNKISVMFDFEPKNMMQFGLPVYCVRTLKLHCILFEGSIYRSLFFCYIAFYLKD
jgi:hypothetical protein